MLCNGKSIAKSLKLKAGDTILLEIPDAKPIEAVPQDIPLDIVYEDDHLLVVNKPKGMVVHRSGNPDGTLVNALLWHCKAASRHRRRDTPRHRPPHRQGHQRPAGGGER